MYTTRTMDVIDIQSYSAGKRAGESQGYLAGFDAGYEHGEYQTQMYYKKRMKKTRKLLFRQRLVGLLFSIIFTGLMMWMDDWTAGLLLIPMTVYLILSNKVVLK